MEIRRAASHSTYVKRVIPASSPWMIIDCVCDCITRGPAGIIYCQGKMFKVRPRYPDRVLSTMLKLLLYNIAAVN